MSNTECAAPDCERPPWRKGECTKHYQRMRKHGSYEPYPVPPAAPTSRLGACLVEGCDNARHSRGWCVKHFRRWQVHGTTDANPNRRELGTGTITDKGYLRVPCPAEFAAMAAKDNKTPAHRLVMARKLGRPLAADETVHHRDGNRLNNDESNLEVFTGRHGNGANVSAALQAAKDLLARYEPGALA